MTTPVHGHSANAKLETKKCPTCAEVIGSAAKKCHYCGMDFRTGIWNRTKRLGPAWLVLLGGLAGATFAQLPSLTEELNDRTQIRMFRPYSGGELQQRLFGGSVQGRCPSSSADAPQNGNAYRCFAGDIVYDPCFWRGYGHTSVVCVEVPWEFQVVLVKVPGPLPHEEQADVDLSEAAWALELRNGANCTYRGGMSGGSVAGIRINYICDDAGVVIGQPNRQSQPWVSYYSPPSTSRVEEVEVDTVWY